MENKPPAKVGVLKAREERHANRVKTQIYLTTVEEEKKKKT